LQTDRAEGPEHTETARHAHRRRTDYVSRCTGGPTGGLPRPPSILHPQTARSAVRDHVRKPDRPGRTQSKVDGATRATRHPSNRMSSKPARWDRHSIEIETHTLPRRRVAPGLHHNAPTRRARTAGATLAFPPNVAPVPESRRRPARNHATTPLPPRRTRPPSQRTHRAAPAGLTIHRPTFALCDRVVTHMWLPSRMCSPNAQHSASRHRSPAGSRPAVWPNLRPTMPSYPSNGGPWRDRWRPGAAAGRPPNGRCADQTEWPLAVNWPIGRNTTLGPETTRARRR